MLVVHCTSIVGVVELSVCDCCHLHWAAQKVHMSHLNYSIIGW